MSISDVPTATSQSLIAWAVIAAGADRSHGGNEGYEDEPDRFYSWDSTVANHATVGVGDVIVLRDRRALLGASIIEEIESGEGEKVQYICPACHKGRGIGRPRRNRSPAYLCQECGEEFDELVKRLRTVKTYRSRHDAAWVDLAGLLDSQQLRGMCEKPRSQLSIRRLRWPLFEAALQDAPIPQALAPLDFRAERLAGGHRRSSVRVRVGQPNFRRQLLTKYGPVCALSGPAPAMVLDACHLYAYADVGVHHLDGGLLLRRDLHRLFDLGLLAIDPRSWTIDASSQLEPHQAYAQLHGQRLGVEVPKAALQWLEMHWDQHRRS